jgi:transitional endoplasmic reticulum ATPase
MKAFEELKEKYAAGIAHTFIFYGATFDYASKHTSLKNFLIQRFTGMSENRKSIIIYDRADGITFPTKSDENFFSSVVNDDLVNLYDGQIPRDPLSAFDLIGKALKKDHFALIVDYAESMFPSGEMSSLSEVDRTAIVSVLKWAKDEEEIKRKGNPIVLITSAYSRINSLLREPSARIESIGIPYPGPEDRQEFIDETLVAYKSRQKPIKFDKDFDASYMARATAGLAKVHIVDIIQRAKLQHKPISFSFVKDRKNDIIRAEFQDVLQIWEPEYGFNMIWGHEHVKVFLDKNVIKAVRAGDLRRVPKGILFMGPAGTGKTELARALAYECGMNFVSWNIGRMKERWVGASEEKTDKGKWAIISIRPVIVFIDELDTAISRGNHGDSGVTNYQMKSLLEFMSDESYRGEIVFLSATNKPEDIDFALKRTGRFDVKIPILPPTPDETPNAFIGALKKEAIHHNITSEQLKDLTMNESSWDNSHNLVGSDISAIVRKAYTIAQDAGSDVVEFSHLEEASALIKPSTQDIAGMIASAIRECNDLSLIHSFYRKESPKTKSSRTEDDKDSPVYERALVE